MCNTAFRKTSPHRQLSTTPDGREGWATYFARKNFPVYVVDHAGRGRSGFDPTPINQARRESNPALLSSVPLFTRERAFANFRFGPQYPTRHQGGAIPGRGAGPVLC